MARQTGAAALKAKLTHTDPESAPAKTRERKAKVSTPLTKLVRLSVDIEPVPYRGLMTFCQDIAMEIGRVRIQHVWVMRALVDELLENKELQKKVTERVEDKHGPDAK